MATEDVKVMQVDVQQAVQSVNGLKDEISRLTDSLLNAEKGTDKYNSITKKLTEDQKKLNEVMNIAKGRNSAVAGSYYDLNAQLVEARKEWKNLSEEERNNAEVGGVLIEKINGLDSQLKAMDASIGQFQRNVGDYRGALMDFGDTLKMLPGGAGQTVEGLKHMGSAMKLLSTNPLMAIIGIITPIIKGITDSLKGNESAMAAIRKGMDAMKPVLDFIANIFAKIGELIGNVVSWMGNLLKSQSDTFGKMAKTISGVGNSILQFLLTPIRTLVAAFKGLGKVISDIFHGDWDKIKDDAKATASEISGAFKKGFSFNENFEIGKEAGEKLLEGIKSTKPQVKKEVEDTKKTWMSELEYRKYILEQQIALEKENSDKWVGLKQELREAEFEIEKQRLADSIQNEQERNDAILLAEQVKNQDLYDIAQDAYITRLEQEDAYQQEMARRREEQRKAEEQLAKDKKKKDEEDHTNWVKMQKGKVAIVQNSLSTMMSLYEAFGDENAKESEGYKAISSAQAMISALLSANESYSAMASIPIVGPALGAAAAAAALASGLAQVRQINSTNMKGGGTSATASATQSAPAVVSAPAVIQQIQTTRTLTSASEEEKLNQDRRVYVVMDDINEVGKKVQVQQAEATF